MMGCVGRVRPDTYDAGLAAVVVAKVHVDDVDDSGSASPALSVTWLPEVSDAGSGRFLALRVSLHSDDALEDFRVRLFDSQDRVVPSDDTFGSDGDGGVAYLMRFQATGLLPGTYSLRVDGQSVDSPKGRLGTAYLPQDLEVIASGTAEMDPLGSKSKPLRRKRKK